MTLKHSQYVLKMQETITVFLGIENVLSHSLQVCFSVLEKRVVFFYYFLQPILFLSNLIKLDFLMVGVSVWVWEVSNFKLSKIIRSIIYACALFCGQGQILRWIPQKLRSTGLICSHFQYLLEQLQLCFKLCLNLAQVLFLHCEMKSSSRNTK